MIWLLASALLATVARAGASCPDPDLDGAALADALAAADAAVDAADLPAAVATLGAVGESLPCLDEAVDRRAFARFARLMATVAFYRQDEALAVRWGNASRLAFPDLPWDLTEDHPLRSLLDRQADPPLGRADGALDVPRGGGALLNGALVLAPEARAEVPYLVQILDARARVVAAYWQDGAAFPDEILTDGEGAIAPPSWYADGRVIARSEAPRPDRAPFPAVPTLVGGGLAVTSVLSYVVAGAAQASLADQATADGLTQARTRANALALVSGVAAAGALGVGVGAVVLTGDGVRVRLRF